ncbi:caspase domain-containing protein [Mycena olivaceomarginata]|nr:caspase domain-containing protein [Mycena olivaceomarginata]
MRAPSSWRAAYGQVSSMPPLEPSRLYGKSNKPGSPVPAPKKKALLVGITYAGNSIGCAPLKGPHTDVRLMRDLLVERYGYAEEDVVTLLDSSEGVQPTHANILRAIGDPVRGARQGHRFFFHYCGHATQIENWSHSEEDGMDECLVPVDGEAHKIMDNIGSHPCCRLFPRRHTINCNSELRRHLIDAPPPAPPSSPCLTRATAGSLLGKGIVRNFKDFAIENGIFAGRTVKAMLADMVFHLRNLVLGPLGREEAFG